MPLPRLRALSTFICTLWQGLSTRVVAVEKDLPAVGEGRLIPIQTDIGELKVWTKKPGENDTIKVILLHGGPGATHEFFPVFARHFPESKIEFYFYDQLGSYFSDQPDDTSLWNIPRFFEEVAQVRIAMPTLAIPTYCSSITMSITCFACHWKNGRIRSTRRLAT